MSPNNSLTFFESLSGIGWLGILLWILFILVILWRPRWFTTYEERFPKTHIFDHLLYEEWHYILFMVIRFLVMILTLGVITRIMFAL